MTAQTHQAITNCIGSRASNAQRGAMNQALIQIGGRNAALRKAVLAARDGSPR